MTYLIISTNIMKVKLAPFDNNDIHKNTTILKWFEVTNSLNKCGIHK